MQYKTQKILKKVLIFSKKYGIIDKNSNKGQLSTISVSNAAGCLFQ